MRLLVFVLYEFSLCLVLIIFSVIYVKNSLYAKIFASRSTLSFLVIMMLLLSCVLRVTVIATGDYNAAQAKQSAYRIVVSRLRGTIFDSNMVPITNSSTKTVAAVSPTPKGIMAISSALEGDALSSVLDSLRQELPAICTVDGEIISEGVATTTVYNHSDNTLQARHIIGYTDSDGHGVTGLELAYDDLLYSEQTVSAVFTADGKGNVLCGIDPYFENDLSVVHSGVVTTLDVNIQNVVEAAAEKMNSGCVIVSEVSNGKIRAMASVPTFDINNLTESFEKENSPLLNRALLSFSVGSVFKPCVAASALEEGSAGITFNCEGSLKIVDRTFKCHKLDGHGQMNLCTALAQSCNCYFYNFAISLGGSSIYKMSSTLNFGSKIKIADNIYTTSGNIPTKKSLENEGMLANLSIGQGDLLLSPVALLNLYNAIAGDGSYYLPTLIEKTIKDGVENYYDAGNATRVMSSDTAAILRQYLQTVITQGTGYEAAPAYTNAAGKTATAQTGRYYSDGTEITNSWFCGFFPVENPKYVVIVMSDSKLKVSTASVFAEIADGITDIYGENGENDS